MAEDRKARLAALASKAGRSTAFRNYTPVETPDLQAVGEEEQEPVAKKTKTEEAPSALQQALERAEKEKASSMQHAAAVVVDAAPKKVNADLKRDIASKLDKLERRTQRAIIELLKERLQQEAENDEVD